MYGSDYLFPVLLAIKSGGGGQPTFNYGASLSMTIDSSTFVVTAQLLDQNGNALGQAQTIDLPLESVVVSGSYDDTTKKVVLTLQNGNTVEFSVADLVYGLQTELSATNKLNPAYINYDSTHAAVSDTEKATWNAKADVADIPTVPVKGVAKNGTAITPDASGVVDITIPTTAADVSALPDSTLYGASISLSINTSTFVVTATLKDQNGDTLGTAQTIDLPLESVVVGGSYNDTTKKVVLTLQSGSTVEFSVADLVAGLQSEITPTNKLDADLVDDANSTHKFATAAQLAQIATNASDILTKIGASDYATQNIGGTVRVWTTTDGSDITLHISNEAPTS
jgi:hypothetical protein